MAQESDRLAPGGQRGQLADVGFDAYQPRPLDLGADVVDDGTTQELRPGGGEQHNVQAAARGADKDCVGHFSGGESGQYVLLLHCKIVMRPVGIPIRAATAAVIDGDGTAARSVGGAGDRPREAIEILGGAGQARQADHGRCGRGAQAVLQKMQAQTVVRIKMPADATDA